MATESTYVVERYSSTTRQWSPYERGIITLAKAKEIAKGLSSSYAKKHRIVKTQIISVFDEKGKLVS